MRHMPTERLVGTSQQHVDSYRKFEMCMQQADIIPTHVLNFSVANMDGNGSLQNGSKKFQITSAKKSAFVDIQFENLSYSISKKRGKGLNQILNTFK